MQYSEEDQDVWSPQERHPGCSRQSRILPCSSPTSHSLQILLQDKASLFCNKRNALGSGKNNLYNILLCPETTEGPEEPGIPLKYLRHTRPDNIPISVVRLTQAQ